jgi:hypothetical protein
LAFATEAPLPELSRAQDTLSGVKLTH